jgi:hypothetical protein
MQNHDSKYDFGKRRGHPKVASKLLRNLEQTDVKLQRGIPRHLIANQGNKINI